MRATAPPLLAAMLAIAGAVAFFRFHGAAQSLAYHAVSGGSAIAVLLGVRLHRPAAAGPWILLAAGVGAMTASDVVGDLARTGVPLPALTSPLLYFCAWLVLAQAVRGLVRARAPAGDRDAVLDAAAVVLAVALVLWRAVLEPALHRQAEGAVIDATIAMFPLAQILLLALYLRLLFSGGAWLSSAWVLAVGGGACGLIGTTAYVVLLPAGGEYVPGSWYNALWMAAYAAPGIAALLPDMRRLAAPTPQHSDQSMSRWTVLGAALIATTLTTCLTATRMSGLEIVATALPVPMIVLWRLRRVLRDGQAAVARAEQGSRRHAVLAGLGGLAGAGNLDALRSETCAALSQELSAEVHLGPRQPAQPPPGTLVIPVPTAPAAWQVLQLAGDAGRQWTPVERSLIETATNLLVAAEARDASQRHVRWAADHDALTGLANRRQLMSVLTARTGSADPRPTTLLLLDLDGFKEVNDQFGHGAGDDVLVATADRLRLTCRPADLVARLAGDEFVVLCPGLLAAAETQALVGRLQDALSAPVQTAGGAVAVTASIGAAASRPGETADELVRRADVQMYGDKRSRVATRR